MTCNNLSVRLKLRKKGKKGKKTNQLNRDRASSASSISALMGSCLSQLSLIDSYSASTAANAAAFCNANTAIFAPTSLSRWTFNCSHFLLQKTRWRCFSSFSSSFDDCGTGGGSGFREAGCGRGGKVICGWLALVDHVSPINVCNQENLRRQARAIYNKLWHVPKGTRLPLHLHDDVGEGV